MNEYTAHKIKLAVGAVLVVVFLWLAAIGQRTVDYPHLGLMMLGLAGILVLLYLYNRGYAKPKPSGISGGAGTETPQTGDPHHGTDRQ